MSGESGVTEVEENLIFIRGSYVGSKKYCKETDMERLSTRLPPPRAVCCWARGETTQLDRILGNLTLLLPICGGGVTLIISYHFDK